ncbi:MAG: flagellar basal body P-ring formation chaperone FlgA [Bacteroidetes bacterium]|nr:flagellar basal body P-ring formation chaperone FlgA [Bacteroidota bacterium]
MMNALIILFSLFSADSSIESSIDNYLKSRLTEYVSYEYQVVRAPKSNTNFEINYNEPYTLNGDNLYLPVVVTKNNEDRVSSNILLKVNLYKFGLLANENIERNSELNDNLFRFALIDVTKLRDELANINEITKMRNRLFIEKDSPVTGAMLEEKPVVNSGDVVWLNSIVGSVNIKMHGVARQDGCVGDVIRTKTDDNKLFRVKVIDSQNVLVLE